MLDKSQNFELRVALSSFNNGGTWITGSSGLIGGEITSLLPNVNTERIDLLNSDLLNYTLNNQISTIIHLAADTTSCNIALDKAILSLTKYDHIRQIIIPLTMDRARLPYQTGKAIIDDWVCNQIKFGDNKIWRVYIDCVYGQFSEKHRKRLIPKVISALKSKTPLMLKYSGQEIRNWIYSQDVTIHLLDCLLDKGRKYPTVCAQSYNFISAKKIVERLSRLINQDFIYFPLIQFEKNANSPYTNVSTLDYLLEELELYLEDKNEHFSMVQSSPNYLLKESFRYTRLEDGLQKTIDKS